MLRGKRNVGVSVASLQLLEADELRDDVADLVTRRSILAGRPGELVQGADQRLTGFAIAGVVVPRRGINESRQ